MIELVAVCIPTRRRPHELGELLVSLGRQRLTRHPDVRWHVVVVDNDPSGSAASVVNEIATGFPVPLTYAQEERPGLARVRNRLVVEAGDVDAIAFIDDDEVASESWLDELLAARQASGADAVGGPVLPLLPANAPRWLVDGRFLQTPRRRPVDGAQVSELGTGNTLVLKVLLIEEGPFDDRLGMLGGEDSTLFRKAHCAGRRLCWADRAEAFEHVPPERLRLRWVLARARREGAIVVRRNQLLHESPASVLLLRSAAFVVVGLLTAAAGALALRPHVAVRGLHRASDGVGRLLAFAGAVPTPYAGGARNG